MKHSEISIELFKEKCLDVFNKKSTPARIAALALDGYEIVSQLQNERLESAKDVLKIILGTDCTIERLRELVVADRDGRALLPPVKVDDPIYLIVRTERKRKPSTYHIEEYHVDHLTFGCSGEPMISACTKDNEWVELISGSRVGKEYFLTREAAEAALAKGGIPNGNPEE